MHTVNLATVLITNCKWKLACWRVLVFDHEKPTNFRAPSWGNGWNYLLSMGWKGAPIFWLDSCTHWLATMVLGFWRIAQRMRGALPSFKACHTLHSNLTALCNLFWLEIFFQAEKWMELTMKKMKWKIFEFLQSTNTTPNTTLKEKASHTNHIKRIKWCKIAIMDLHEAGPIIRANFQGTQRLTKPTFYFL